MDVAVIVAIIGAIETIGAAAIAAMISRYNKKNADYLAVKETREKAREKRDACMYELIFATASGTEVLLHQAHGEKLNGNVSEALAEIKHAKAECNHTFNEQAARL